ncbi:MAG: type IX secretion system sortase PorU, partial [Chitinophagaceae bacterium]|nr:type IX secretion system sortase PorU [Chitinophagaceae bacterium]
MKKLTLTILPFLLAFLSSSGQKMQQFHFESKSTNAKNAFEVYRANISSATKPSVKIINPIYKLTQDIVSDSILDVSGELQVFVGTERKRNYAFIQIPRYKKNGDGTINTLVSCDLEITEATAASNAQNGISSLLKTTNAASVLSNGTWQKIAVGTKGVYKIDYDYVKNVLGQSGTISSATIRLFGNGGTMVNESNAIRQPDDLAENAIEMVDGGDGNFGPGDYFLFYANGPMDWVKDSLNQRFYHRTNIYSDSSYYFISFNNGNGLRLSNASSTGSANTTVSSYNDYALHEKELINLGLFGKTWWGETFGFNAGQSNTQDINFNMSNSSDSVTYRYQLASAAVGQTNTASFVVKLNGQTLETHTGIYGITGQDGDNPASLIAKQGTVVIPNTGSLSFNFQYTKFVSIATGYLDFVEVNIRRQLLFNAGQQLSFRDWRSVAAGAIADYRIGNASNNLSVWDVTNPLAPIRISGSNNSGIYSFVQDANRLKEFIAFDNNFLAPKYIGLVPNQNLHGLAQADYIIVTHPEFMTAANKLADFHRTSNNLTVHVIPTDQVYNEFASGAKDISAIRDMMRMFYERAGKNEDLLPKYLLLLGQASFDYKNIIPNNAKLVPTYETAESLSATSGYCTDDYYAILDSNEDINLGYSLLDIGVGRIPATNATEASAIIDKIIRYKSNEALGPWRINNVFIGDDEDNAGNHLLDADEMYQAVESTSDLYKAQKVYLNALNIISTPGGARCPEANKIINDNIFKGTFLMNYSGHGSIYTLAHERIVTQDDYNSWNNQYKMPIMITATCDFSRFDNPALQSAGEKIMLKSDGGAIALVTTTQVVYATYNRIFNISYLHAQFTKNKHGWNTFGQAFQISKNDVLATGDVVNSRKFALLGDPALTPNFPRYDIKTDSIKAISDNTTATADTVKSLGAYRVFGTVRDDDGVVMNSFNGKVNITFFDKKQVAAVQTENSGAAYRNYDLQNNIIYKGIASVVKGTFTFEFIAPKDINYEFGKGKISYYADNGTIDAAGADTTVTVGGFADNIIPDNDSPIVRVFMNDSLFRNGGLTGTNSILYAIITDKSGINVSGNFVGHDLTAVLDNEIEVPYILNDYYETAPNTYQKGFVTFPITGLADGIHTIKVKAWDVHNNSGQGHVVFEVLNGSVVQLRNIYNYPNPFTDLTHFVFEHNHPNEALKATIYIYNTTGSLLRIIHQDFTPSGSNSAEIVWNGTGNGGEKLPAGIYPYRIRIATEKNI